MRGQFVPATPYLNQPALLLSLFLHFPALSDGLVRPEPMLMLMLSVSKLLLLTPFRVISTEDGSDDHKSTWSKRFHEYIPTYSSNVVDGPMLLKQLYYSARIL